MNEPSGRCVRLLVESMKATYHLTLAQSASSINIKANIWKLPAVAYARMRKTINNAVNAPSRILRNIGFRDEPGCRMLARKPICSVESADDIAGGCKSLYLLLLMACSLYFHHQLVPFFLPSPPFSSRAHTTSLRSSTLQLDMSFNPPNTKHS